MTNGNPKFSVYAEPEGSLATMPFSSHVQDDWSRHWLNGIGFALFLFQSTVFKYRPTLFHYQNILIFSV